MTKPFVLSAILSLRSNSDFVSLLIGLDESAVLLTLSMDKLVLKAERLIAPVPPRATGTTPNIFSASTELANLAYATY